MSERFFLGTSFSAKMTNLSGTDLGRSFLMRGEARNTGSVESTTSLPGEKVNCEAPGLPPKKIFIPV